MAQQETFSVAIYNGGILAHARFGRWKNRSDADAYAARKVEECARRGWNMEVCVESSETGWWPLWHTVRS